MTGRPNRLGIAWVMFLFTLGIFAPVWFVPPPSPGAVGAVVRAATAGFVSFCLIAVLFWASELRPLRLPGWWHRLRPWESESLYRHLGVAIFRAALLATPLKRLNKDIHVAGAKGDRLERLDGYMRTAEANHVIAFLLTAVIATLYQGATELDLMPWFGAFNLFGNLYPVLLQRMNRLRLNHLAERLRARSQPPSSTKSQ